MLDECNCQPCTTDLPAVKSPPLVPRNLGWFNEVKPRSTDDRAAHRAAVEAGYASLPGYVQEHMPLAVRLRDEEGPPLPQMVAQRRAQISNAASPPARRIIAFTGLAGSGKSTAALHLCDIGWTRVRFAGPLKAMMAALGLTPDEIEGHLKEQPCELLGGKTPRYGMQSLGTEWGRNLIAPDLWIRAWQAAVSRVPAGKNIVVDDCRFANEAEAVLAAGGHIIRVVRNGAGSAAAGHASEQEMASLPARSEIENNGTVADFLRLVEREVATLSWVASRNTESMTTS